MGIFIPHIVEDVALGRSKGPFTGYLLFTDINNFTRMTRTLFTYGDKGEEALGRIIKSRMGVIADAVICSGGDVLGFEGDGMTASFPSEEDRSNALGIIYNYFKGNPVEDTQLGSFELGIKHKTAHGSYNVFIDSSKPRNYLIYGRGLQILYDKEFDYDHRTIFQERHLKKPQLNSTEKSFISDKISGVPRWGEFRNAVTGFVKINLESVESDYSTVNMIVRESGGYVNKLCFSEKGSYALCLWGAPLSSRDFKRNACNAMHLLGIKKMTGGFTYGKVYSGFIGSQSRQEYTVLGESVNLSARLMTRSSDSIMIGTEGLGDYASFEDEEEISMKGTGLVKSAVLTGVSSGKRVFTGRRNEILVLNEFINNEEMLMEITGRHGIGKTALVNHFIEQHSLNALHIRCRGEYKQYRVLKDILINGLFLPDREFDEFSANIVYYKSSIMEEYAQYIWQRVIEDRGTQGNLNSEEELAVMSIIFDEILRLLKENGTDLLFIDNSEWLDGETSYLISQSRRRPGSTEIVVSGRKRIFDSHYIELDRMDQEIEEIVKNELNAEHLDSALKDYILKTGEGNPYYTIEILHFLTSRDMLVYSGSTVMLANDTVSELPSGISDAIITRTDSLPEDAGSMIRICAIDGYEFGRQHITEAAFRIFRHIDVENGLNELTRQGLFRYIPDNDTYVFTQQAMRDVLYRSCMPSFREKIHRQLLQIYKSSSNKYKQLYHSRYGGRHYYFKNLFFNEMSRIEDSGNFLNVKPLIDLTEGVRMTKKQRAAVYQMTGEYYGMKGQYDLSLREMKKGLEYAYGGIKRKINSRAAYYLMKAGHYKEAADYIARIRKSEPAQEMIRGMIFLRRGKFSEAEKIMKELLDKSEDLPVLMSIRILNTLGVLYSDIKEPLKALEYYKKAVAKLESDDYRKHPFAATVYSNTGYSFYETQQYEEAEEYYTRALDIRKTLLGEYHPDVADSYNNIAMLLYSRQRLEEALSKIMKAVDIMDKTQGQGSINIMDIYSNAGNIYDEMKQYDKAMGFYKRALRIAETNLKHNHPKIADKYNNLGQTALNMKDYVNGEHYLTKALSIYRAVYGRSPATAFAINNLGELYRADGNNEKAKHYFNEALAMIEGKGYEYAENYIRNNIAQLKDQ